MILLFTKKFNTHSHSHPQHQRLVFVHHQPLLLSTKNKTSSSAAVAPTLSAASRCVVTINPQTNSLTNSEIDSTQFVAPRLFLVGRYPASAAGDFHS